MCSYYMIYIFWLRNVWNHPSSALRTLRRITDGIMKFIINLSRRVEMTKKQHKNNKVERTLLIIKQGSSQSDPQLLERWP